MSPWVSYANIWKWSLKRILLKEFKISYDLGLQTYYGNTQEKAGLNKIIERHKKWYAKNHPNLLCKGVDFLSANSFWGVCLPMYLHHTIWIWKTFKCFTLSLINISETQTIGPTAFMSSSPLTFWVLRPTITRQGNALYEDK